MKKLKLDPQRQPVQKNLRVRTDRPLAMAYLPMLLRLDENWDVKAFCYD